MDPRANKTIYLQDLDYTSEYQTAFYNIDSCPGAVRAYVEQSRLISAQDRIAQLETDNKLLAETLKRSAHENVEHEGLGYTIAELQAENAKLKDMFTIARTCIDEIVAAGKNYYIRDGREK